MTVGDLATSAAWQAGLHYLQNGYFWEAHEALEPVWMQLPPNSVERKFVQAVIQAANAALKLEMKRPRATLRLCDIAKALLASCDSRAEIMGVSLIQVSGHIEKLRNTANL